MNVIVNGCAIPGGGDGETDTSMEFGEISQSMFTLDQLAGLTGTEGAAHRIGTFQFNTDQQFRYDATGLATVQYEVDTDLDLLFMTDTIIDGPFLLMLMMGTNLKAFHCENCAGEFINFFVTSQPVWKSRYHGSLSEDAPTPKKLYQ